MERGLDWDWGFWIFMGVLFIAGATHPDPPTNGETIGAAIIGAAIIIAIAIVVVGLENKK